MSQSVEEIDLMREQFDLDGLEAPEEQWSSAKEGLSWAKSLKGLVRPEHPGFKDPEAVASELGLWQAIFEQAAGAKARWHLSVDF